MAVDQSNPRCAICLSTERIHESTLIICKKCKFSFHKDCLNEPVSDENNFECAACQSGATFQSCSLCSKGIQFPFEKDENGSLCHMCCRFWRDFTKTDLRKKCSICKQSGGDLTICSKSEKGKICSASSHILCAFNNNWLFDEENKRIFCPMHKSVEGFTESNHLFLFYISCRRLYYLIQDINSTESELNNRIYSEWKSISNDERQIYVNSYSQIRQSKRPLLNYEIERNTLKLWWDFQMNFIIKHLNRFKDKIKCPLITTTTEVKTESTTTAVADNNDNNDGKKSDENNNNHNHKSFDYLINEIKEKRLINKNTPYYIECYLLRRIKSIYNLDTIYEMMIQILECNNNNEESKETIINEFKEDFEYVRKVCELKYEIKSYKYVSDLIEKNDQPCVQNEWRQSPFPTRYYEEINKYELCEGMNDKENELTMKKLKSSMKIHCDGSCCSKKNGKNEIKFSLNLGRFESDCPCMISGSECSEECKCSCTKIKTENKEEKNRIDENIKVKNEVEEENIKVKTEEVKEKEEVKCEYDCNNREAQQNHFINPEDDIHIQNVWGMDCYTRRCLEISIMAIDKSLEYAQNYIRIHISRTINTLPSDDAYNMNYTLIKLADSDDKDIALTALAILEQTTTRDLNYFRIHPKGMGIICKRKGGIKETTAIAPYLGEVYPPWRWFEKQDGIKNAQKRLGYKPVLPDFYNITLERNIEDEKGYDVLFVDPVCRGNLGSRLCHSCDPNCATMTVNVNGQFTIVVYAIRDIDEGEELTFDYACVSESEEEYRAAICLCSSVKCRGSFLYFTNARAFQQVMSSAHTFLSRTAIILRSCVEEYTKDDESLLFNIGIRDSVLENAPLWLKKYAALISEYILYEYQVLPSELVKITTPVALYNEQSAEIEAKGVRNSRLHNLVVTIDKILYFLRHQENAANTLPLRLLRSHEVRDYLWNDEHSLIKRLYSCIISNQVQNEMPIIKKIGEIVSYQAEDLEDAKKKMKQVKDLLLEMKPRRTARHLAAHDLLVLYIETNCFFTTTATYQGFTSDVDIRTCDLGMSNDSFQKALKKKKNSSDDDDDDDDDSTPTSSSSRKQVKKNKTFKRKDINNAPVANAMQVRYRDVRRYGGCYAWGQLVGWYKQTVNNPAASLYADRRGTLSLPDIESCYGTDYDYSPSARQVLIERIVNQPSTMWPVGGFWKFKNPFKVYGSPMFDFYLMNDPTPLTNCMNEINVPPSKGKPHQLPSLSKLSVLDKSKLSHYMDNPIYTVSEVSLFLRGLSLSVSPPVPSNERIHSMKTRRHQNSNNNNSSADEEPDSRGGNGDNTPKSDEFRMEEDESYEDKRKYPVTRKSRTSPRFSSDNNNNNNNNNSNSFGNSNELDNNGNNIEGNTSDNENSESNMGKNSEGGIKTRSQTGKLKRKLFTDDVDDPVINEYYKQLSDVDDDEKPKKRRKSTRKMNVSPTTTATPITLTSSSSILTSNPSNGSNLPVSSTIGGLNHPGNVIPSVIPPKFNNNPIMPNLPINMNNPFLIQPQQQQQQSQQQQQQQIPQVFPNLQSLQQQQQYLNQFLASQNNGQNPLPFPPVPPPPTTIQPQMMDVSFLSQLYNAAAASQQQQQQQQQQQINPGNVLQPQPQLPQNPNNSNNPLFGLPLLPNMSNIPQNSLPYMNQQLLQLLQSTTDPQQQQQRLQQLQQLQQQMQLQQPQPQQQPTPGNYLSPEEQYAMLMNQQYMNMMNNPSIQEIQQQMQRQQQQQQQQQQRVISKNQQQQQQQQMAPQTILQKELSKETKSLIESFEKIVPSLTDPSALSKYIATLDVSAIKSKYDLQLFISTIVSKQFNNPIWNEEAQNASKLLINRMNEHLLSI